MKALGSEYDIELMSLLRDSRRSAGVPFMIQPEKIDVRRVQGKR